MPDAGRAGAAIRASARARARWTAGLLTALVLAPVLAGLLGVLLPALGYLPALGARDIGLDVFRRLLAEPGFWRSVGVSALSGFGATALSVLLTASILAAAYGTGALRAAERLLAPILSVPHAAAALGFVFLFAPSGFLARLVSPWPSGWDAPPDLVILNDPLGLSLLAALVVKETPFLFLMALAALPQVRAGERMAVARSLGYGPMTGFVHAVWPLVYRQLRLPILAVLAFAVSVVDMALILGPTRPPTLAVRIVGWLRAPDLDGWLMGSAGAALMVGLVVALVGLWLVLERLVGAGLASARTSGWRGQSDAPLRLALPTLAAVGVGTVFCGFAGLVLQSFAGYWPFPDLWPGTLGLGGWRERLHMAAGVLEGTLAIALGAMALALPIAVALLEAERRGARIPVLVYAPLVVPQIAFLFGLDVLAIAAGVTPGRLAVTLAHGLFVLPYALIALSGPWRALDPRFEQVAASLGAGPVRRFVAVRLPLLARPLAVAAALAVAVSVGLYLPTQMIGSGRVATVTTEAVAAASAGDRRLIGMFATLQLLIPLVAFSLARGGPMLARRLRFGGAHGPGPAAEAAA